MNQLPPPLAPDSHTTSSTGQPTVATSAADTTSYLLALLGSDREDLLDALRVAADWMQNDVDCRACAGATCTDSDHTYWLQRVHVWRRLAAGIGRLLGIAGNDEPMIRFDAEACRTWLSAGIAERAGIDEGFSSGEFTIATGLEELLSLLNNDSAQHVWRTVAHLERADIWRTADSDGVDGGGILTADLRYMGQLVRLASLHQGSGDFTDDPATSGIDAAVQVLGHVAATLNREYVNLRRATGRPSVDGDDEAGDRAYTVVGVWIGDQPVPVGVIAGDREVSGGDDGEHFPQGVWATTVTADDGLAAERDAIDQMRAENQ